MYEEEIDLKELLYTVFKKWRLICMTAVLAAVLCGGYKLGRELLTAANDEAMNEALETYETAVESHELKLRTTEKQIATAKKLLETESLRLETVPLMLLDPAASVKLSYGIYVKLEGETSASETADDKRELVQRVIDGYVSALQGAWMDDAAERLSMETKDLTTIVGVRGDGYTQRIYMDVYASSKEEAEKILGVFESLLFENQNVIKLAYGNHTLEQASERLIQDVNRELSDRQLAMINQLTAIRNSLSELESGKKALEETELPEMELSAAAIAKRSIKSGVAGLLAGGFVMSFFVCVAYLMSDKVKSMTDVTDRFGLKALGEFPAAQKPTVLPVVDKWIDRLFGHDKEVDINELYHIIAINTKNYLPEGARSVLVTGAAAETTVLEFTKRLKEELDRVGLRTELDGAELKEELDGAELREGIGGAVFIEGAAGLHDNYKALAKLPTFDAVILLAEKGKTTVKEMETDLGILKSLEKPVVGVVVW